MDVDVIMPKLNYTLIKAKTPHMNQIANIYISIFCENKNREEGNQLAQLIAICEFAEKITSDKLFNISDDQFIKRCQTTKKNL